MSGEDTKIYGACACIGLFHRKKGVIVEAHKVKIMEILGGKCLLDAVTKFQFPKGEPKNTERLKTLYSPK